MGKEELPDGQAASRHNHQLEKDLQTLDERKQGWFDRLVFGWVHGLVLRARRKTLEPQDLPLPQDQHANSNFDKFQKEWEKETQGSEKREPSLFKALWRIFGTEFVLAGVCKFIWSTLVILGAFFFVRSILQYVDPKLTSPYDSDTAGIILMVCFFVDAWLLGIALQRMGDLSVRVGIKMRAALVTAVTKKALSMESVSQELSANIVGFVSSDINKVFDGIQQVHYLWAAPIEALVILALLTSLTKLYALPGYVIVGIVLCMQYLFGYLTVRFKKGNAENVAARVALAQEALPAMKLVKYYCWEQFFINELNNIRAKEQPWLWKLLLVRVCNAAMVFVTPPLTAFVVFTAYEFMVGRLQSDLAFTTLSLFNILRFPLVVLPKAIRTSSEGWASLKRLEEFLLRPLELRDISATESSRSSEASGNKGVSIVNGVFEYKDAKDSFSLHIPEFDVKPGEVVGIAGRVGSGKTSVINAILGYIEQRNGTTSVSGSLAYVRQSPWLQNITCRENILFGEPYEQEKYNAVVEACALELDFRILADADQTKAGLRGINLSGGQRQRINVARAAYSEAEIMLLDSPLSAVDYHTSSHIFNKCIKGLFKEKAVVLVTHNQDLLPKCDKIAIMEGGRMVYFGPFSMTAVDKYLPSKANELLDPSKSSNSVADKAEDDTNSLHQRPSEAPSSKGPDRHMDNVIIVGEEASCKTGYRIGMALSMRKYWLEGGLMLGIASVLIYSTAQTTRQILDYWIRQWAADTLALYPSAEPRDASLTYSMIYMGITIFFGICLWMRGFTFFNWTKRAANGFFRKYVNRTFGAPLAFFLNNPVGDLINVFSKDQDVVDENMPETLHFMGIYGIIMLTTIVTVSIIIPMFSIFTAVLAIVSFIMLAVYLGPATQLKLLTAESSGTLTGLVSEALEGLDVIQAYKKQIYFIEESEKRTNMYHRFFFNSESLGLWLAFYCDFFGAVLVLAVSIFAVLQKDQLGAANVGLAFSNVIQMLVFYTWVIRYMADTISYWGSVERVSGLALTTPKESDLQPPVIKEIQVNVTHIPPDEWTPSGGNVRFENVWMRYRFNLPWALKGVNFEFLPQEKIGVVGRTGSGKSTLLLALYRMFELGYGRILYDEMDIALLNRNKLRRSLSIIPQEPLMFSGTLRANLDPYQERTDLECWMALEKVGLKPYAESMNGGLEAQIDGTTSEWSLGQKQLLCLARAVLTRVPVLCLDEATAAMDPQTEQLVLRTIDEVFEERTTITIAHRLDVVIKADKILVMEQGENMEMDTPDALLSQPDSFFSNLVDKSGPTQAAALRHIAREVAIQKGWRSS